MKAYLILILSLFTLSVSGQTLLPDPSTPTTKNINAVLGGSIAMSGTNTYTGSLTGLTSYTGFAADFQFAHKNTSTTCTANLNSLGAKSLKKFTSSGVPVSLDTGDIKVSKRIRFYYNATFDCLVMMGGVGGSSGGLQQGNNTLTDDLNFDDNVEGTHTVSVGGTTAPAAINLNTSNGSGSTGNVQIGPDGFSFLDQDGVGIQIGASVGNISTNANLIISSGPVDLANYAGTAGRILTFDADGYIIPITTIPIANGGTAKTSFTQYAPVFGGTTTTGPLQSGSVGTSGHVLTSNGSGALPTFQAPITLQTQTPNTVFAGPASGSAANPTFRAQVVSDLPFDEFITDATTSRTISASDRGKIIRFTSSSPITVTLPNGITQGFECVLTKAGSGDITLTAATTLEGSTVISGTAPTFAVVVNRGSDIWITNGAATSNVTAVGSIDTQTKSADGAVINSSSIYLQTADASNPGLVSISAQTFTGAKTIDGNVILKSVGNGLYIKQGTNSTEGRATLVAGSIVVSTTKVTANSDIFLTSQVDGGTPGFVRVSTRTAGSTFTITSSNGSDTSTVAWFIIEPAP